MSKATDKQTAFMTDLKLPWNEETTFEQARMAISAKVGNVNVPVKQVIADDKPKKSGFDTSSYYVAYAKDLCIALLGEMSPHDAKNEELIVRAMKLSINMIKDAKEAFS